MGRDDEARTALPRRLAGFDNIQAGAPQPGRLYLAADAAAPANAVAVAHYPSPPTVLGGLIRPLGLGRLLPAGMARRLFAPNPAVTLWRIAPGIARP